MRRRFIIEVAGEFATDTTPSDLALAIDGALEHAWHLDVFDFHGDDGCEVFEVTRVSYEEAQR